MESAEIMAPFTGFGKRNRQLRLADSGRTGQDNQRFFQKNHLHNSLKFLFQFPFREGNDRRAGRAGSDTDLRASKARQ